MFSLNATILSVCLCVFCAYIDGSATHYIDFKSYPLDWLCDHNYAVFYLVFLILLIHFFFSDVAIRCGAGNCNVMCSLIYSCSPTRVRAHVNTMLMGTVSKLYPLSCWMGK